jgi:mono/diheme cytochrome c family protein
MRAILEPVCLLCLALLVAGCDLAAQAPAAANVPPDTNQSEPYRATMEAQGFVELVTDETVANPPPPETIATGRPFDRGAETYRQVCLACHGDFGQGLTDEWRAEWGEDSNCWQSRCHGSAHPPWGFTFPQAVPPLLGPGALSRFQTAADLYTTILSTMPWWDPGSLTESQSWELTTYLMAVRGELAEDAELDKGSAIVYRIGQPYTPAADYRLPAVIVLTLLAVAAMTLIRWRV